MNKYALFAGQDYYPDGGIDDFYKSSDSIGDLEIEIGTEITQRIKLKVEWAHIADLESMKIVSHLHPSGQWRDGPCWGDYDLRVEEPEYIERYGDALKQL